MTIFSQWELLNFSVVLIYAGIFFIGLGHELQSWIKNFASYESSAKSWNTTSTKNLMMP